jgi:hypothetical protein
MKTRGKMEARLHLVAASDGGEWLISSPVVYYL